MAREKQGEAAEMATSMGKNPLKEQFILSNLAVAVALCSYQFHPKPTPPRLEQTPKTQLIGGKNPPPRTINHCIQKRSPGGQNR